MSSPTLFATFFLTTLLFACMPGPAMLYTAAQTLARGRKGGLMAALGIHVGGYVHVAASAAGLTVLFHAIPTLYMIVKLAGAAYLVWLGITLWRSRSSGDQEMPLFERKSARRAFAESIAVEALNPKTALFFLAFLPQFIDLSGGLPVWAQFLLLGTIVNLTFSTADIVCAFLAGTIVNRLKRSGRATRYVQRAGGAALIGIGAHLALQRG
jgi:threonine/homoserine/homoserine lactone efflux protein